MDITATCITVCQTESTEIPICIETLVVQDTSETSILLIITVKMWLIKCVKSYLLLYEWYIIDIKSEMVFFAFYYNLKCLKLELTI